jgi:hypothetical protein
MILLVTNLMDLFIKFIKISGFKCTEKWLVNW